MSRETVNACSDYFGSRAKPVIHPAQGGTSDGIEDFRCVAGDRSNGELGLEMKRDPGQGSELFREIAGAFETWRDETGRAAALFEPVQAKDELLGSGRCTCVFEKQFEIEGPVHL